MPTISRFYGILIRMYYDDHSPPHVHVVYGEQRATIEIDRIAVLGGALPARALGMVTEWVQLHQEELMADWQRARERQPLVAIEPLP
jgi:hypothetical protein